MNCISFLKNSDKHKISIRKKTMYGIYLWDYLKLNFVKITKLVNLKKGYNIIIIITLTLTFFQFNKPIFAADNKPESILKFQNKVSKNITNKFCNSIGFGLSKESAIKFSIAENKKEVYKNKLTKQINKNQLKDSIASNIIDTCGNPIGLIGEKGVEEFKNYLTEIDNIG
ncbi:hypothetical protein [Prochlorococcus sp. MIT 1223]|uniref:hypothetical protein n=1 Tax=Prochlorococcus sp. MIT 1223 TaxID=3096217 RepID=UPI002A7586F9|nr:hypothetical protein [Prochlorococcus sp. MIT 1223]